MSVVFVLGAIASGKSSAARYLESRGARRIDLDVLAKQLYIPGSDLVTRLADAFGGDIVDGEGRVRLSVLSDRAFCDAAHTSVLTGIVYPALEASLESELSDWASCQDLSPHESSVAQLAVVEVSAPRGFEHAFGLADSVLLISAPHDVRMERAVQRGMNVDDFLRRDALQPSDDELRELADYIIDNEQNTRQLYAALDAWTAGLLGRVGERHGR